MTFNRRENKSETCSWLFCVAVISTVNPVLAFLTTEVKLAPGTFIVGLKKISYDAFYGVPFARPPVGQLRFRDPVPALWWTGTFNALLPKFYCWQWDQQIMHIPPSGTEDCLYLNIYRPRKPATDRPLNVIVNIHGGGFYAGNNSPLLYGPEYFMETGQVILVSLSYRLNVFGFMATGDEASPGNYGLKDITMALRWVRTHIGAFGGDPEAVTLLGQSAGGVAINYHLVSRHSEGLYKNAFMLSGTISTPWARIEDNPREVLNRHARALGIKNAAELDSAALVEVFRRIPAKDLTASISDLYKWDILPMTAYRPVVEPLGTLNAFLRQNPLISVAQGDVVRVPVMISTVPADGINFVQPLVRLNSRHREFNHRIYSLLPVVLEMDARHPNMTHIVDSVRAQYLGPSGVVSPANYNSVVQMATDYYFERPLYTDALALAHLMPVYVHQFAYRGLNSFSTLISRSLRDFGVVHVDDLLYLFRFPPFPVQLSAADKAVQQIFMRHVLSFVKFSDPGYPALDETNPQVVRFRPSARLDLLIDRVPMRRHDFWGRVAEIYESDWGWRERVVGVSGVGNFSATWS